MAAAQNPVLSRCMGRWLWRDKKKTCPSEIKCKKRGKMAKKWPYLIKRVKFGGRNDFWHPCFYSFFKKKQCQPHWTAGSAVGLHFEPRAPQRAVLNNKKIPVPFEPTLGHAKENMNHHLETKSMLKNSGKFPSRIFSKK